MNCKKVKNFLFADYLDGELESGLREKIKSHLETCASCRDLEGRIKKLTLLSFKEAVQKEVPESIWVAIKQKLSQIPPERAGIFSRIKESLTIFSEKKYAFAWGYTLIIFLLVFSFFMRGFMISHQLRDYFSQQIDFYVLLENEQVENGNNLENLAEVYYYE